MSRPLHIALVSAFPPGMRSLNEYGYHLALGLAARDDVARVTVIADTQPSATDELNLGPKIAVERVWTFNSKSAALSISKAVRACRADGAIFNVQTASFGDKEIPAALGLMTPFACRLMGTPSGIIAHNIIAGVDLEKTTLKGKAARQSLVRAAGSFVTYTMTLANYMTVTLQGYSDILTKKYPRADVSLVPHGTFEMRKVDCQSFDRRPKRIVTMGKFGTYKRLETLLAAFDKLRRNTEFQDYELVIGGTDHPATAGYLSLLSESRRADKGVTFAGYVAEDDVPDFFGRARLSIFDYSATTGSSGVLHQTASSGAVPVFPKIGDFVDLCRDEGLEGVHYLPGDADDMALAMEGVLSHPEGAQAIADNNRVAAAGMPFSEVVAFHVDRIRALGNKRRLQREATAAQNA